MTEADKFFREKDFMKRNLYKISEIIRKLSKKLSVLLNRRGDK